MKTIREEDFDNLFNTLVTKVMENKEKRRDLFNAISDVYEIKEYIPEIMLFEKREKQRLLVFKYIDEYTYGNPHSPIPRGYKNVVNTRVIDLEFTLGSFSTFFKYFLKSDSDLIDKDSINNIILPAIELLIEYIEK